MYLYEYYLTVPLVQSPHFVPLCTFSTLRHKVVEFVPVLSRRAIKLHGRATTW